MNNDPFFQGIARLVATTTGELVENARPTGADQSGWEEMATQWFHERLKSSPRNHSYRNWFVYRSILQLTGLDPMETALLHLGPNHPSSFLTPERLLADKLLKSSPAAGWQRFWIQERKLQASSAQLVEERGWCADTREAGLIEKYPLFGGRLLKNAEQRTLVVLPSRDTDPDVGIIGPIDSRHLALTFHDVRQHGIPFQAGGIVTIDPQSLAASWHETLPDYELGRELANLREEFWTTHVLGGMPLPAGDGEGEQTSTLGKLDDEQLYKLGILVLQHCLSREYRNIAEGEYRECRKALHDYLKAAAIPHGEYVLDNTTLDFQMARDPARTRKALEDLQLSLDDFRLPLIQGETGEFNRDHVLAAIDELRDQVEGEDSGEALEVLVQRLVGIPVELGPLDMDKAVGHLLEKGLVTAPSIHVERLVTKVSSGDWNLEVRELKTAMKNFFEDRVKRVMQPHSG